MQDSVVEQYVQETDQQGANLPVGELLRRTRVHYGLTLPEVEAALRIRASQLGAIEDGRHDLLPGRVYAIGFVRTYAEFLGLDGNRTVNMFKKQAVGARARPELSLPATASESKIPNLYVIAASVVMLLGIGVGLFMFDGGQKPLDIPAVPTQLQAGVGDLSPEDPLGVAMASVTPAAGVAVFSPKAPAASAVVVKSGLPSAEDAKLPAKQLSRMSIKARENVWIEIRSKEGKALVSRILEPGDEYRVPDETGLVMDTGNAGAFDISVDGKLVPALGEKGDIKRKVALDPDAFLASSIAAAAGAAKKLPEGKSELLTTGEIEQAEDIAEIEDATPEPDVRNAAPVPAPATQQRKFKPRYINQ